MKQLSMLGRREFLFGAAAVGAAAALSGCSSGGAGSQGSDQTPPSGEAEPKEVFVSVDEFEPPKPVVVEEDPNAHPRPEYIFDQPSGKLEGKIAVVTGASSGIGREIARTYAREGAKVVAVARREDRLMALAEESKEYAGEIAAFKADLTDRDQVRQMVQFALDTYGYIDILVNNAGYTGGTQRATELMLGGWDYLMELNVTAPVIAMKYALQGMLEKGSGCIINVASVAGIRGSIGGIEYTTSKHALIGASKNTAFMYAQQGIRCNVIAPGGFRTECGKAMQYIDEGGSERISTVSGSIQRQGEPEEIASMALFLASPGAIGINGAVITNDGGWMC